MSEYVTEYYNEKDFNDAWHHAEQKRNKELAIEKRLGSDYKRQIFDFLEHQLELHKQNPCLYYEVPTFSIMRNLGWQGKSYWVNKALSLMAEYDGLQKHKAKSGYAWSLPV